MGPSGRFLFTVWFRDSSMTPDEEDYEWPACFEVLAASIELASNWGLHVTHSYLSRKPNLSLLHHSTTERSTGISGELPVVRYGMDASDSEIGW